MGKCEIVVGFPTNHLETGHGLLIWGMEHQATIFSSHKFRTTGIWGTRFASPSKDLERRFLLCDRRVCIRDQHIESIPSCVLHVFACVVAIAQGVRR